VFAEGSDPEMNGLGSDAEEVGYLCDRIPLFDALDSQTPPSLQFSR
jgi:hypothetical protein